MLFRLSRRGVCTEATEVFPLCHGDLKKGRGTNAPSDEWDRPPPQSPPNRRQARTEVPLPEGVGANGIPSPPFWGRESG